MTTVPVKTLKRKNIKYASGVDAPTDFEAGVDDGNTYFVNNTTTKKYAYFLIG